MSNQELLTPTGYVLAYSESIEGVEQSSEQIKECIQTQIRYTSRMADKDNMRLCDVIRDVGIDRGRSIGRVGLKHVLDNLRAVDCLILTSLFEILGDIVNLGSIIDDITSKKAHLIALKNGFDTTTTHGRYAITILAAYSDLHFKLEARVTINEEETVKLRELVGERRFGRLEHLLDYPSLDPPSDIEDKNGDLSDGE